MDYPVRTYIYTQHKFFLSLLITIYMSIAFSGSICAQSDPFDKRYDEVYLNTIATDVVEAERIADSLVDVASTDEQKMKSLMLLANIQSSRGNLVGASARVIELQKIANQGNYYEWQARSSGFLASTFRAVGLLQESKKYLDLAEIANEKQQRSPKYLVTKVNILQERAFHAQEDSLFTKALQYLEEGDRLISQIEDNAGRTLLVKATNEQLKSICYLHMRQLTLADSLLQSSLARLGTEESNLRPYIYRARAEIDIHREQYDSAYHYLQMAEPYIASSKREELKTLLYGSFVRYYRALGQHERAGHYSSLYQDVAKQRERVARSIASDIVRRVSQDKEQYEHSVRAGWWIVTVVVGLLVAVLIYVLIKRSNEHAVYKRHVEDTSQENSKLAKSTVVDQQPVAVTKPEVDSAGSKEPSISHETETRLLKELETLEQTAFFLEKEVSLAALALRLNTNQRYVSYIIRKHRNMDFNSYIQHYRIHYIINRIKLEPELLDYKLSYLAELAGFSSHSKFSAVFKAVTGLPPSVFIHYRKKELEK